MRRSRYVAYVEGAETCCSEGHPSAADALKHAAERIRERKKERRP